MRPTMAGERSTRLTMLVQVDSKKRLTLLGHDQNNSRSSQRHLRKSLHGIEGQSWSPMQNSPLQKFGRVLL